MFGEYSVDVTAIVTMRHVVPWRFLPRLLLARRRDNFFDAGCTTFGTFWISHEKSPEVGYP